MTVITDVDVKIKHIKFYTCLGHCYKDFIFLFSNLLSFQVGYLSASIRSVADARVGDTITHYGRRAQDSLPGYEEAMPMVFCGLFPVEADQY